MEEKIRLYAKDTYTHIHRYTYTFLNTVGIITVIDLFGRLPAANWVHATNIPTNSSSIYTEQHTHDIEIKNPQA